jgi:hypothetical protein
VARETSIDPYDSRVQRPAPDEVRRVAKAVLLGLALGVVLLAVARPREGSD